MHTNVREKKINALERSGRKQNCLKVCKVNILTFLPPKLKESHISLFCFINFISKDRIGFLSLFKTFLCNLPSKNCRKIPCTSVLKSLIKIKITTKISKYYVLNIQGYGNKEINSEEYFEPMEDIF